MVQFRNAHILDHYTQDTAAAFYSEAAYMDRVTTTATCIRVCCTSRECTRMRPDLYHMEQQGQAFFFFFFSLSSFLIRAECVLFFLVLTRGR